MIFGVRTRKPECDIPDDVCNISFTLVMTVLFVMLRHLPSMVRYVCTGKEPE